MDFGNSCSLQPSSGDDEEYDSRLGSVPAFLNISGHFGALSYPHPSHQPNTFFYPSPSYLNNVPGSSSSSQSMLGQQGLSRGSFPSSSSVQTRPPHDSNDGVRSSTKNPKKRTRASKRAPTTVLATDTTNFRAMVQEFTGIPAPPFSPGPDLFGSGSGIGSGRLEQLGSVYPLRPSAKRVQPSTPFVSSSSSSPPLNNPLHDAANTITDNNTIPSNYQLPSDLPQNMLNLQNQSPVLPFQFFLDPRPLHPWVNRPGSHGSSAPSLDELGLSHGQANVNPGSLARHRN